MSRSSEVDAQGAWEGEGGLRLRRGVFGGDAVGGRTIGRASCTVICADGVVLGRLGLAVVTCVFRSMCASDSSIGGPRLDGLGGFLARLLTSAE